MLGAQSLVYNKNIPRVLKICLYQIVEVFTLKYGYKTHLNLSSTNIKKKENNKISVISIRGSQNSLK